VKRVLLSRLLLLLVTVAALAHAQSVNGAGAQLAGTVVDFFGQFGNAIDRMVVEDGSLFLGTANSWLDDFGPVALFFLIFHFFRGGVHRRAWLLEYAFGFLTAKFLLTYYSTPTALLGGSSVSHFFLDAFKGLANQVDVSRLEPIFQTMANILGGIEPPSIFNPLKLMTYAEVLVWCTVLEVIIWVVTLAGLLGTGIGATIGSLFIPWFVFPSTRFLTMRWLNFMLLTSAYRLVGALYVRIFSDVLLFWYSNVIGSDFHLARFLALMVPTFVIAIVMFILVLFIFHWTHDLFSGTLSAALGSTGAVRAAAFFFMSR
jgi:TrbL/VirB6 plasmid conjugal transfer protein